MTPRIWGYVPDYQRDEGFVSAQANASLLAGVSAVQWYLDEQGEPTDCPGASPPPPELRGLGLRVLGLVANLAGGKWDAGRVARAIGSADERRRHIERLVARVAQRGYDGIEVDYEELPEQMRDAFSTFVEEMAPALHGVGKYLAVAVHAKQSEPGESEAARAQDWARIGAVADHVAVMAYDFDPSRPGPVSPLDWTRRVVAHARALIPNGRLVQGVPLYGYLWTPGSAPTYLTHQQFMALAERHDREPRREAADLHLVLTFEEAGIRREAWLPDAETAAALAGFGNKAGVDAFSIWHLGGEETEALARVAASASAARSDGGPRAAT